MKNRLYNLFIVLLIFLFSTCVLPEGETDNEDITSSESIPPVPFSENFDTTSVGSIPEDWFYFSNEGGTADNQIEVVDNTSITPVSNPNCLKLWDNNNETGTGLSRTIGEQSYGQLSYRINISSAHSTKTHFLLIYNNNGDTLLQLELNNFNGINIKKNDGSNVSLGTYTYDTWLTIDVKWDRSNNVYQLFVNSEDLGTFDFMTSGAPYQFKVYAGSTSSADTLLYIDDISLKIDAESISSSLNGPVLGAFEENFESVDPGDIPSGWLERIESDVDAGVVNTSTFTPFQGERSMQFIDDSAISGARITKKIGNQNYGQLSLYLNMKSSTPVTAFYCGLDDQAGNKIIDLGIAPYPVLYVKTEGGDSSSNLTYDITYDNWHHLQINWDRITGYHKVVFNGISYGPYQMLAEGVPCLLKLTGGKSTNINGRVYVDQVSFTTDTVPISAGP